MSVFNFESAKKAAEDHRNASTQMTQMFIKRLDNKKSQVLMEGLLYGLTETHYGMMAESDGNSSIDKSEVKEMLKLSKLMCEKLENVISALQELQIVEEEENKLILGMMKKHEDEISAFEEAHPDIANGLFNEDNSD
jgi:predicted ATP-dependent protease